jgi:signal transduction histidine kinase
LDHFGLATALRAYVEATCNKAGIQADIRLPDESEIIPKDLAITLFRIVQEGLNNIIRHAQAKHVTLEFSDGSEGYALTLRDDGHGFDANSTQGQRRHGIMGMQHRVRALGGRFSLESKPDQGTTLMVTLPRTAAA